MDRGGRRPGRAWSAGRRSSGRRPRAPCAAARVTRWSPTAPSPTPRRPSAASTSSRPPISTSRCTSRRCCPAGDHRGAPGDGDARRRVMAALDEVFRQAWPVVVASTARLTRDLDLAEDCTQEAFERAAGDLAGHPVRTNPAGVADHDGPPDRARPAASRRGPGPQAAAAGGAGRRGRGRPPPDRPAPARLHLLPPGAGARVAGGADAAPRLRGATSRRSPPSSCRRGGRRPPDHPREAEDRDGAHPVPRPARGGPAGAAGRRADRRAPRLHRRARRRPRARCATTG